MLVLSLTLAPAAFACGTPNATDAASPVDATDAHAQPSKPACEEIARRCHAFDDMPGTGFWLGMAETARSDGHVVMQEPIKSCLGVRMDFFHLGRGSSFMYAAIL